MWYTINCDKIIVIINSWKNHYRTTKLELLQEKRWYDVIQCFCYPWRPYNIPIPSHKSQECNECKMFFTALINFQPPLVFKKYYYTQCNSLVPSDWSMCSMRCLTMSGSVFFDICTTIINNHTDLLKTKQDKMRPSALLHLILQYLDNYCLWYDGW